VLLVGDGTRAYPEAFARLGDCHLGPVSQAAPSAAALVELAVPRFEREEFVQPFDVHPLYLRRPDVDPNARVAARASGGPARRPDRSPAGPGEM
jgi:tRNA A37 threonylcarbamoyladenosine modification protein TsaB